MVRSCRLVLLTRCRDEGEPFGTVAELLEDPRLADAGVPNQLDEAAEAHAHRHERRVEHRQLALAVDERKLLRRFALPRAGHLTDRHRVDGFCLSLQAQCTDRLGGEDRPRPLEEIGRRPDRAGVGLRHQPGRECGGAAEDRERLSVGRPDAAREDVARGHADVQRQPRAGVDRRAHRAEQALLVPPGSGRHSRDKDDPPADRVDVALEEADAMRRGRFLHHIDHLLHRVGVERLSAESDERDRGLPVLALDALRDEVRAQLLGDAG